MLNDVERGRFLEQPPREHLAPFVVGPVDDDLHERAGQLILLPRLGLVTGFQAHNDIVDPHGGPRFHHKIARQTIAFVQDTERRNAFGHRRRGFGCRQPSRRRFFSNDGRVPRAGDSILDRRRSGGERNKPQRAANKPAPLHAASGLQAS
jgi:hypothetical protein